MTDGERVVVQVRRSGERSKRLELRQPLPDALMVPYEISSLDPPPGTPTGEFATWLNRRSAERAADVPIYEEDREYT